MAGPWDNMNPEFSSRVQALIAASGGRVRPGSGFRTVEEQVALRKKNGCPDVWTAPASSCRVPTAIPGRSNHNHGLAMDLQYSGDGAKWAAANAARFGLHFPVRGENWHVEMIGDDGSHSHMHGAMRRGALGFDLRWQDEDRTPRDELHDRLNMIGQILGAGPEQMPSPETQMPSPGEMPSPENPMQQALEPEDEMRMDETTIGGGAPPPGAAPGGSGVERWRGLVAQALQYVGEAPTEANIAMTLRRMQQESGGDPNIVNDWDSNARRGTPSIGLMQVILPTFNAHAGELAGRGQRDPFANLVASMRYAKSRYGSLASAYNRRGGY